MVNKRATNTSYYTCLATKRGSKDSSDSFGTGLTSEDIVDRLLSTEHSKSDENIIPVFLTFFRKFMKPYELVKILVERFENDGVASDAPSPTDLQKRIHSIFSLWLSHYWNDFYGPHARKHIILFLDRISKYDYLTPICDSLAPLVVREPPSDDPDKSWGLVDDENEDDADSMCNNNRLSWSSTRKRNEKKDSGYASGSFSVSSYIHHQPTSPSPLSSPTTTETFLLKRLSNNNCTRINQQQELPLISPNLNRLLRRSSNRKAVTHSESHPNLRSSYATNGNRGPLLGPHHEHRSATCELPSRAEFAGGLINIDHVAKLENYYTPSFKIAPSIASTRHGAGWSLGTQLLASSFISSFRQHQSDKDRSSYDYKVFMKMTDAAIADQLTWIEAELFCRIKSREFVRNIWHSSVHSEGPAFVSSSSNNNALSASVAHFNFISAWAVTMIVTQTRLSKRALVLEKFMLIAVALRNHNNYNTLMAILAGINSASVLRLKRTRQAVFTKKVFKQFQSLERLMSTDRSFSSYRMALKATGAPGIPYLGIHNQDLVSLAEANKDFRADGTIHWEKFRLMGETIMATMKFKYPGYSIEPDSKILTFIADSSILSEDEQYKRSTLIEPRLASSSTNRIRDLWLKM
ncbi:ras guanine nucleotide exchange factor domain-containing protein [Parasitella parasitica]|nr:ras guanine nucleotide exchange factor domain-containing protein [Parasitella parasitica]